MQDAIAADKQKNGDNANPGAIIKQFASDTSMYQSLLGSKVSNDDKLKLSAIINTQIADSVLDSGSADDLKMIFADSNGNLDDAKLTAIIDKAKQDDPAMFTDQSGAPIATADVVSMMRSAWDTVRQGNKIGDTLPKVIDGLKLNVSDSYKRGLLHIGSSMFAGGILAARSAQGGTAPTDVASRVSAGMQFFGTLVEGGSKYAKDAGYGFSSTTTTGVHDVPDGIDKGSRGGWTQYTSSGDGPFTDSQLAKIGNAAKVVGGAGGVIGGILGIYSGVKSAIGGDAVGAGFSLASGGLGAVAGLASIIEGAAGLFGASGAGAWAGAVAGVFGWAGAVLGAVAGAVLPIIEVFKRQKAQDHFFGVIDPVLFQYGLTGGPEQPGDYPDDQYPIGV
jgi:hypothetical protein